MDLTLIAQLFALAMLLGLSAFFSSSETSLFSLSTAQLQQMRRDRNPRLRLIEQLLSEPRRLIATILIGNELVNVCASVLSATIVIDLFGVGRSWLNVVIMVPLLLLFGEITPKTLALANNVAFATVQSRYIDLFARLSSPLRKVVRAVSEFFIEMIVSGERATGNILTEDMVRTLAKAAVGEGSLDTKESEYIHQIFDFGNKTVADVMTVRSQMASIDLSMTLPQILEVQHGRGHSKLPVFSDDGQSVRGVLFARDLLGLVADEHPLDRPALERIVRKPYLVPGSRMAADLFVRLRERRSSLALVTDEFGGIIGIVTLEDLLECIFGELPSRSDTVRKDVPTLETLGTDFYRASGNLLLRQFNEVAGTDLGAPGVSTLAGLVLHACGEMPAENDTVTIDNVIFTATSVTEQRILTVTVQVSAPPGAEERQGAADAGADAVDGDAPASPAEPQADSDAGTDAGTDADPSGPGSERPPAKD